MTPENKQKTGRRGASPVFGFAHPDRTRPRNSGRVNLPFAVAVPLLAAPVHAPSAVRGMQHGALLRRSSAQVRNRGDGTVAEPRECLFSTLM